METLKPGNIVAVPVLDFFLTCTSHQSQTSGESTQRFYYLSKDTIGRLTGDVEEDQTLLRQSLAITTEEIIPAPLLFLIVLAPNTYFLVMFDFIEAKALILGRHGLSGPDFNKAFAEWESWNGRTIWWKLYHAFLGPGSEELDRETIFYEADLILVLYSMKNYYGRKARLNLYFQRDSHSGPGISGFVQLLQDHKWNWKEFISSVPAPEVPCDHQSREWMFRAVLQWSYLCFKSWKVAFRNNTDWTQPPEHLLDEMNSEPARLQWIRNLKLIFLSQAFKCKRCSLLEDFNDMSSDEDVLPRGQNTRALSPCTLKTRPHLPDPLPLTTEENTSAQEPMDGLTFIDFDDYGSSPFRRQYTPAPLNTWTFDSSGLLALPNWASTWKDQGYRLPPGFDRVSLKKDPIDYVSRLLPIEEDNTEWPPPTISETHSSSDDMSMDEFPDSKRKPISMGASLMLDEAGRAPKTKESYNVFVRGKTRADDFIKFNFQEDHLPLPREQITISVDIDSILWVTRGTKISCRGAINLHLKPHFAAKPPFSSNPSIYITLLQPPEIEAELNDPRIRPTARFPLSSIPHMPFGYFGEATQQFNLYVFFPRMVHKNPNNNRAITIMPQELQELWLSEAVFKSLAASMDQYPGTSEYLPKSIEQLRWKSGGHARQPTLPISPPTLASLLANIRLEISENNADLLSCFGSFFFVLDARGIKMLTKQHTPEENAFQSLQMLVPSLDWDHMLERENGELYLDLGVSFHPTNTPEPMVGLWKLSNLRSSYALMGHSKKNHKEYHHNTMQDYGGIKAETSDSTRHNTYISKRISYNLHFEAVRQPGEQAYISTLDDMIRCNQKYLDGCQRWVKVLEAAEKNSYGVRDELRASAHVVNSLLPMVRERV